MKNEREKQWNKIKETQEKKNNERSKDGKKEKKRENSKIRK